MTAINVRVVDVNQQLAAVLEDPLFVQLQGATVSQITTYLAGLTTVAQLRTPIATCLKSVAYLVNRDND